MNVVSVSLTPSSIEPRSLRGHVAVAVDVLRATSTIVRAIESGAERVIPCLTPDEAIARRASLGVDRVVLGGERGGVFIPGFDLGNSPLEYTPLRVSGKIVVFTTTNGTRAILACSAAHAAVVTVGAFGHLSALAEALVRANRSVHIACAGTNDRITGEDCLLAGILVNRLVESGLFRVGNDEARLVGGFSRDVGANESTLREALRASAGGRNLMELGFDRDIDECARVDWTAIIPVFDPNDGSIRSGKIE